MDNNSCLCIIPSSKTCDCRGILVVLQGAFILQDGICVLGHGCRSEVTRIKDHRSDVRRDSGVGIRGVDAWAGVGINEQLAS